MKCLRLRELIKNKYGSLLLIQSGNFKGALLVPRGYSVRNMTGGPTYFSVPVFWGGWKIYWLFFPPVALPPVGLLIIIQHTISSTHWSFLQETKGHSAGRLSQVFVGSKTVGANIFGGNKHMALVILGGIKFETLSDLPCHVFTRVPPWGAVSWF